MGKGISGAMVSFDHLNVSTFYMFYEASAPTVERDSDTMKILFGVNRSKGSKVRA